MKSYARVIRHFFETTTFHGFKYLYSKYYCDRLGWLLCCCASACCSAVLCAVVWARFMQVPALLTLQEMVQDRDVDMPLVAICPPVATVARMFSEHFEVNATVAKQLPRIFERILRRKYVTEERLAVLSAIIDKNGITFKQALFTIMPACETILRACQWQDKAIACGRLFTKMLTQWGVCCTALPKDFKTASGSLSQIETMWTLSITMQCYNQPMLHNCEFFTKYDVEEWFEPTPLRPGYSYEAHLTSVSVIDSDLDKLFDGTCAAHQLYSRSRCLLKCMEQRCGCSDVVRINSPKEMNVPPTCTLQKLSCLRDFKRDNNTCNCLPTCKKVTTSLALESSRMSAIEQSFNTLYANVDVLLDSVINIRMRISGSRIFTVNPTETWITLLSSLGGVFNMFLGIGFFSALELLFLTFLRLPIVMRKSTEIEHPNT
ncbi:uncharacterized protein LOC123691941 [Colias croceus]|uniref:uncharacterized protein LOC123691941 n=1 Tax=Colias crocea TaxID=72248 RepID=UPI001E27A74B|nr:uncharacterized protein LOC123691941 [Colias croceus]